VITSDLSIVGSAKKLYTEVTEADLQVDLLINNAGYGRRGSFTEIERADYASMIQLNITTLTELCHLMIPDMVNRGNG
jgi:short-subunit dehydrogenase